MIKRTDMSWVNETNPEILKKMLPHKLNPAYERPTFLDTFAQQAIIISKRSTCLFNEVGAVVFYNGRHILSSGYNGAAGGDFDPKEAGCARIVNGELKEGQGFCRGSHAELNAISNITVSTMNLDNVGMMVTLRPCFACAKQIVNKGIKELYYIWEYSQDEQVVPYMKRLGVRVHHFNQSKFLDDWIKLNGYEPPKIAKKA